MSHHRSSHVRTSRRVPPLTDKDIDHEINLVDHDKNASSQGDNAQFSKSTNHRTEQSSRSSLIADQRTSDQSIAPSESREQLTQNASETGKLSTDGTPVTTSQASSTDGHPDEVEVGHPGAEESPESSDTAHKNGSHNPQKRTSRINHDRPVSECQPPQSKEPQTEIDILYENERGGFLCGIPLFSSAALGNLDPPAWTNFAHKPSPTDIHTAQVPDPSWQWAWPEWRINMDEEIQPDKNGWEYSFMFSKKFSWHPPKWYSSFVRRRAWIRRRVKISIGYQAVDVHAMNPAYFTVAPRQRDRSPFATASEVERVSLDRRSRGSEAGFRSSRSRSRGDTDSLPIPREVRTTEDLMAALKQSRIDREKLEAVENYISNCTDDLLQLRDYMHEIMSMFVFQTSRKTLLARLTHLYDDVTSEAQKGKSSATAKSDNLAGAIKHADEEVRRLEYWSDIKGMAEGGEAVRAVDHDQGWDANCWQGLDNSGAKGIDEDEITR